MTEKTESAKERGPCCVEADRSPSCELSALAQLEANQRENGHCTFVSIIWENGCLRPATRALCRAAFSVERTKLRFLEREKTLLHKIYGGKKRSRSRGCPIPNYISTRKSLREITAFSLSMAHPRSSPETCSPKGESSRTHT